VEEVVVYFKISRHSLGGTEEYHEKFVSITGLQAEI
jgi:hypothetical protein